MWKLLVFAVIDASGYRILENGSLRIETVDVKDAGIYVCVAQNSAGTAMSQAKLEVQGYTDIMMMRTRVLLKNDTYALLCCLSFCFLLHC